MSPTPEGTARALKAWRFRLHDPFTTSASQLGTNLADHFKADRFDFQHLGYVFAEMLQLATAVRASRPILPFIR